MEILQIIALILLIPFVIAWFSFAPWAPTRNKDIKRGLDLAKIKPNETLFDLWCWDWRVVFFANKYYKAKSIWIELCFTLFFVCKIKQFFYKNNVCFKNSNLYKVDLSWANIIYLYWMPDKLPKLKEKFKMELKKWTRIISYVFKIEWWEPKEISREKWRLPIYLYEM